MGPLVYTRCENNVEWPSSLLPPEQHLTHWDRDKMAAIFLTTIFLNENVWISISISLKFAPEGTINNVPHWFR